MSFDECLEWANKTSGLAAWVSVGIAGTVAIGGWRVIAAKAKGISTHPSVRSAMLTAVKVFAVAGIAIALDRGISSRAVAIAHQEVAVEQDAPKSAGAVEHATHEEPATDERSIVADQPKPHVAAKPIVPKFVEGKPSHANQALSQFRPDPEHPGYFRCVGCNQLGFFRQVNGTRRQQFVEVELAPEPPAFEGK